MTLLDRLRQARDNGAVFAAVLGLLLGVVITALLVPKRQETTVVQRDGAADASSATGTGGRTGRKADVAGDESGAGGESSGVRTGQAAPRSGGGGGRSGGDGASGSAAQTATPGIDPSVGAVRGVFDDKIVLGVTYPDLSALKALGPAFDNGEPEEHWRALVDWWRRDGLLPVHGRDIELRFRSYNVLNTEEQRAACRGLVSDDKVFMVVGQTFFAVGSECVAREFRTPLVTSDGPNDDVFRRSHPFLFSLSASESRHLRNFVHWGHHKRVFTGKEIGLYYLDTAAVRDQIAKNIKAELSKLGYKIAAEHTTGQELGGPQDAVAVRRFQAAGVDVAMLFTSKAGFMQQAEAQQYRPMYIDSDYFFGTSDTTTSQYPPEQFDGALGITGRRVGETRAGIPLGREGDACVANYERFANKKLTEETAEWAYVLTTCDLGKTVLHALRGVGPEVSIEGFVAGLETVQQMPMNRYANVTWLSHRHDGGDAQRTVRWFASCRCWKAEGGFEPLWVP